MKHHRYTYPEERRYNTIEYHVPVQMVDSRSIPMPNEEEKKLPERSKSPMPSIFKFLKNINFEDLILIGLIILLISEEVDDDILIILLIYILLT